MNSNTLNKIFIVVTVAVILLGVLTFFIKPVDAPTPESTDSALSEDITATLSITDFVTDAPVAVTADTSVLSVLQTLNENNPDLQLATESYEGLGTLVTSMAGQENGTDGQYWQYTVDGVMPQVGADAYVLQGGEAVVWEFKASEY